MQAGTLARNLALLAPDGRLVQIAFLGAPGKTVPTTLDMLQVMVRRLTITGSTLRPRTNEFKAGLARAVLSAVGPGNTVGGSTITQQLAKNLLLHGERTVLRKGQELVAAGMSGVIYCGSMGDWPLLTDEQRQEIKEAFDLFDTDGSGSIAVSIQLNLQITDKWIREDVKALHQTITEPQRYYFAVV